MTAREIELQVFALHFKGQQLPKNRVTSLDAKNDFVSSFYVTKYASVTPKMSISLKTALVVIVQKQASSH